MIEISLAVIAVTFVILAIFLIIVLLSVRRTLQHVNKTIITTRHKVEEMTKESMKLLKSSADISDDFRHKLLLLDSLFQAVSLVGDHTLDTVKSIKSSEAKINKENHNYKFKDIFSGLSEWVAAGIHLWHTIKKGG